MFRFKSLSRAVAIVAAVATFGLVSADFASAKVGGGSSVGSRGGRTFSAPPSTNTAPNAASPIQRSTTQPGATVKQPSPATAAAATASRPSMFGGFRGLLLGGLIGAGLASIFGAGAFANVLGFVLQAALIGGLVFLAYNFFRNRGMGTPAMATARSGAGMSPLAQNVNYRSAAAAAGGALPKLAIQPDDFNAFQRLLGEIQTAYGRGDTRALGDRVTPEMLSYFAGDLAENAKKGVRNEISEPKLLQGDLSEAWREAGDEYATVAMRFSLIDRMVDVSSGRVVAGSATEPQESTELWTFRRPANGTPAQWELSAIQQA